MEGMAFLIFSTFISFGMFVTNIRRMHNFGLKFKKREDIVAIYWIYAELYIGQS